MQFENFPALIALRDVGRSFLVVALVLWIVREVYRLMLQGSCDLVSPVVRVGIATIALTALPGWGNALYQLAMTLSSSIGADVHQEVFTRAIARASAAVAESKVIGMILGHALGAALVCLAAVKMFIIDLLFPAMFAIVLTMGLIGIPIGIFPGINSVGGWLRSLIEISLWPLSYQLVVATLTWLFRNQLAEIAKTDFGAFFSSIVKLAQQDDVAEAFAGSPYFLLVQLIAFLALFCVLTLFSPAIAAIVMRSQPAGFVGGIMTAKVGSLAKQGLKWSVGKALGAQANTFYNTSSHGKSDRSGDSVPILRVAPTRPNNDGDDMNRRDSFDTRRKKG